MIPREESDSQEARNGEYKYLVDPEAETRVRRPHPQEAGDEELPKDLSRTPREGQEDPPVERAGPNTTKDARNKRIWTLGRDPERAAPGARAGPARERSASLPGQATDTIQVPTSNPREGCVEVPGTKDLEIEEEGQYPGEPTKASVSETLSRRGPASV